jgi:membrane protein DedA with SNARE-associated domain
MLDWLLEAFNAYPYYGVAIVFLACGLGLPLPEEIVLVTAGYVVFKQLAQLETMMAVSAGAILLGDAIPFALGRHFGASLLRIRPLRIMVTPQRLARFDRWFRRRGDLVIFFSRFVAGIRVVSFFTAGTMRTTWRRFLLLDLAGIALLVPPLVYIGYRFGGAIDEAIVQVQRVERGILIMALGLGTGVGLWYWIRWRRRQRLLVGGPAETFVEPSEPVRREPPDESHGDSVRPPQS